MKKKTIYTLNVSDQDYEDMQGEENKDNIATTGVCTVKLIDVQYVSVAC